MNRTRAKHARACTAGWGRLTAFSSDMLSKSLTAVFPILYMALLLVTACVPTDGSEVTDHHFLWFLALVPVDIQNFLHIPAYAILAFLWRWSLNRMRPRLAVLLSLILTMTFGVTQEWAQSLVPGRFASLSDILFDAVGAVIGLWLYGALLARVPMSADEH